ncbi:MAG: hypothetical protein ACO23S_06265 [Candidatus Nanopelagicaceae bacterium]
MGRLIPTGVPNRGHQMDFVYEGEGEAQKCFMTCECGWRIEIESFRHPWSLIEVKARSRRHMQELGLEPND